MVDHDATIRADIEVLKVKMGHVEKQLDEIESKMATRTTVERIEVEVKDLIKASSTFRAAIIVVWVLGGFIGWMTTVASTVIKVWPFKG